MQLFSDLKIKDSLKQSLDSLGFTQMKRVQSLVIPHILANKDVIVHSQTGSGKTLAYLVPLLNMINGSKPIIRLLIILPTRELCSQVGNIIRQLGYHCEWFIGGQPIENDLVRLDVEVCIGTPGRIMELIVQNTNRFKKIEWLVIDECDKLLDIGFESKLRAIVEYLPKNKVTCMLSATCEDEILSLGRFLSKNPIVVRVDEKIPDKLDLKYILVEPDNKIDILLELIKEKKAIVFFSTCAQVEMMYSILTKFQNQEISIKKEILDNKIEEVLEKSVNTDSSTVQLYINKENNKNSIDLKKLNENKFLKEIKIHKIHGKMDQILRSKIYEEFELNKGVLLCTDLAARGIDFKNVNLVIHFDIPKDYQNIIHRSGRTARNGNTGESILFLMNNEKLYIDFLKLKNISVEEIIPHINSSDFLVTLNSFVDDDFMKIAVRAFVSYIRSYKEHIVNYILAYKELNYDALARLFFLRKIPSMPELKKVKFTEFEHKINENNIKKHKKNKVNKKKNK